MTPPGFRPATPQLLAACAGNDVELEVPCALVVLPGRSHAAESRSRELKMLIAQRSVYATVRMLYAAPTYHCTYMPCMLVRHHPPIAAACAAIDASGQSSQGNRTLSIYQVIDGPPGGCQQCTCFAFRNCHTPQRRPSGRPMARSIDCETAAASGRVNMSTSSPVYATVTKAAATT